MEKWSSTNFFLKKLLILTRSDVNRELIPLFQCRDYKGPFSLCLARDFGHLRVTLPCLLDRYLGHWA